MSCSASGSKRKPAGPSIIIRIRKAKNALKKVLPDLVKHYGHRLYFEDELRSDTRSACKRRWTPKGHQPLCKVKLGYAFTYLYCALAPATGKLIAWLLPEMTLECFELFMDHFKQ